MVFFDLPCLVSVLILSHQSIRDLKRHPRIRAMMKFFWRTYRKVYVRSLLVKEESAKNSTLSKSRQQKLYRRGSLPRLHHRRNTSIVTTIKKGNKPSRDDRNAVIPFDEYISVHMRMQKALKGTFDEDEAYDAALEDWQHDTGGSLDGR